VQRKNQQEASVQSPREVLQRIATTFDRIDDDSSPLSEVDIDVLKHEYDLHTTLARDAEGYRATTMTFIVTAVGAIIYALSAVRFDARYWPLAFVIMLLGVYVTILSGIYHERWEFFMMIARGCRWRIAAARPGARIEEIRSAAKLAHRDQFLTQRQLYKFWRWLGVGIIVVGVACSAVMLAIFLSSAQR
jgi:hypothetical protein